MHLTNPFTNKRPINKIENFYGHGFLVETIFFDYINNADLPCLSLVAERSMGKSTILNALFFTENIEKYEVDSTVVMVYLDFAESLHETADFYKTIHSSINTTVQENMNLDEGLKKTLNKIYEKTIREKELFVLQDNFKDMMRRLAREGYKSVLVIDNFENAVEEFNLTYNEFNFLRTLANPRYNVQYIIASLRSLDTISIETVSSGFYNIFTKETIPLFNEKSINQYVIHNFHKMSLEIKDDEIEWIKKASGGYPYILRSACNCLLTKKQKNQEYETYENFIMNVNSECYTIYDSILKRASEEERQILKALTLTDSNIVEDTYQIKALVDRYLLKDVSGYEFVSDAFKHYFKHIDLGIYQSMDEVAVAVETNPNSYEDAIHLIKDFIQAFNAALKLDQGGEDDFRESVSTVKSLFADKIDLKSSDALSADFGTFSFWDTLESESKENLLVAERLNALYGQADLDLAFISLLYCRSVELEINTKLLPYLQNKFPNQLVRNDEISNRHYIMIGELEYLTKKEPKIIRFVEQNSVNLVNLRNDLRKLRDIRNNTAHSNDIDGKKISKEEIKTLRGIIFRKANESFFDVLQQLTK
ncbi:ATP-binding protein [Clostridiaceae bacterium 35-E11]